MPCRWYAVLAFDTANIDVPFCNAFDPIGENKNDAHTKGFNETSIRAAAAPDRDWETNA